MNTDLVYIIKEVSRGQDWFDGNYFCLEDAQHAMKGWQDRLPSCRFQVKAVTVEESYLDPDYYLPDTWHHLEFQLA